MRNRQSKTYKDLPEQRLASLQLQHARVKTLQNDELSLHGRCFLGNLCSTANQVFNYGDAVSIDGGGGPDFGLLDIVIMYGDFCAMVAAREMAPSPTFPTRLVCNSLQFLCSSL